MLDKDWIAECARYEWAIVSGDKNISKIPEERQAVIDGKCKVFMLDDSHETKTEDWAASLLVARERLIEIATRADGPFFVTIKRCKVHGHVSLPDFVLDTGAGWKVRTEQPIRENQPQIQIQPKRVRRSQQKSFDFVVAVTSTSIERRASLIPHCDLCAKLFRIA